MARLQNSAILGGWTNESPPFIQEVLYNEFCGWQNLAEEEAYQRHIEEMENKND